MFRRIMLFVLMILSVVPVLAQAAPAPLDPATLTATEIIRLPLLSGPVKTTSLISPDGEWVMHVQNTTFCLYSIVGEQIRCSEVDEQIALFNTKVAVDPESIVWSPDGR